MILTTLMVASLLNVSDPSGDAVGAGQLNTPKAAIFRELANFDVLNLSIAEQSTFAFELSMASLENPWNLPLGFSLPIIEVYAAINPKRNDSRNELLAGSGMSIDKNKKWNYAFRITGNDINVYTVRDSALQDVSDTVDLHYTITENRIYIETNIRIVGDISVYAMTGSYDPFSETGWRAVGTDAQPWGLSSTDQDSPVLDIVVDDFSIQQRSIKSKVLPEITAAPRQRSWLWIVVAGLLTCLLALISRPRKLAKKVQHVQSDVLVDGVDISGEEASIKQSDVNLASQNNFATSPDKVNQPADFPITAELQPDSDIEVKSTTKSISKHRPIQWTSWDEGELASEDTIMEFDRIANEEQEAQARATQPPPLNVEVFETPEPTEVATSEVNTPTLGKSQFQENLLPDVEDESLLSSKNPPKGFTKRMKNFGLEEVKPDEVLDDEDLKQS